MRCRYRSYSSPNAAGSLFARSTNSPSTSAPMTMLLTDPWNLARIGCPSDARTASYGAGQADFPRLVGQGARSDGRHEDALLVEGATLAKGARVEVGRLHVSHTARRDDGVGEPNFGQRHRRNRAPLVGVDGRRLQGIVHCRGRCTQRIECPLSFGKAQAPDDFVRLPARIDDYLKAGRVAIPVDLACCDAGRHLDQ